MRDFTPIAKVGVTPMTFTARPGLGVNSVDRSGGAGAPAGRTVCRWSTTGTASLQAFAAVALQRAAGIDLLGVPYKGGAPILNDLLAGQLDLGVMTLPAAMAQVRAGKLVMLGVLSDQRPASAPELPTVNEVAGGQRRERGDLGRAGRAAEAAGARGRAHQPRGAGHPGRQGVHRAPRGVGDMTVPFMVPADFGRFLLAKRNATARWPPA